ncbi:NPR1/NH1-interacting protein [Dillenia turbinata]|uniref:NPR1/NH1-interacting protein n=1 Tax=Dillenia turbinata TaxID=194707 RepID=A0AAN8ZGV7_9MAGN
MVHDDVVTGIANHNALYVTYYDGTGNGVNCQEIRNQMMCKLTHMSPQGSRKKERRSNHRKCSPPICVNFPRRSSFLQQTNMKLERHRRKRKLWHIDEEEEYREKQEEEEDDDDDEIKMEKFYAIVRNMSDARNHFMNNNNNNGSSSLNYPDQHNQVDKKIIKKKKNMQRPSVEEATQSVIASAATTWHPTFELEDFLDDPSKLTLLDHHQPSGTKEEGSLIVKESTTKEALDLNLSL